MSRQLIHEYRAELDRLKAVSGSRRESVLREAFKDLLKRWGRSHDLHFVPEHDIVTPQKNRIYLDGALLHALRVPFGYWEAKDADDDLDAEIAAKTRKGYPRDNIIYSDDHTAILIQNGHEIARVAMGDPDALYELIIRFFAHERQEIADFNKAVKQFATDLPAVLEALRNIIAQKRKTSKSYSKTEDAFLKHAQNAINPAVTLEDVQEMLLQHILTEDIFAKVFDNPDFHRQNNVASELYKLEGELFGYGEKQQLLRSLQPYYAGISQTAAVIQSHSEKQGFLKGLYENFYKVYNPKAADKLGVVYTPGEIVRFMIRSADWLCEKHFGKNLIDRGVEILDPATGTGTYIVELLEYFRGYGDRLRHKYKEELHANELAILPYYVANLNIEATYQAITGQFAEFENLCLVDTLDNVDALGIHAGHQYDLLGSLSDENIERIKRQNRRKISVIIGNPPYNANQQNENDNNKNRTYAHIDARIKSTYIKASTAQKTKLYDMYARFFRWASDRLGDEGVVAFVTNNSYIDSRTFDGFRKTIAKDFNEAWIVDLKGNARTNGEQRRREGGNVFEDKVRVGISICFLVKIKGTGGFRVRYKAVGDYLKEDDKRQFVSSTKLEDADFEVIAPNKEGLWINQPDQTGWEGFLPVFDAKTKSGAGDDRATAIFKQHSLGVITARDEWVYDTTQQDLSSKLEWFVSEYEAERARLAQIDKRDRRTSISEQSIKLTRSLKNDLVSSKVIQYHPSKNRVANYRPFVTKLLNFDPKLNEMQYKLNELYPSSEPNPTLAFRCVFSNDPIAVLAIDRVFDYGLLKIGNGGTESLPRYRYSKSGERIDNITDWALNKFIAQYGKKGMSKDAIFAYCYAVLHDPIYREKYALNLKREFPRIPFYPDFPQWVAWGEALMKFHIGYEAVEPFSLDRVETPSKRASGTHPKPVLKSNPEIGSIMIDADTQLTGIPPEAWEYRLGNRSGIDWVLDQHKEKKPKDPTIAAKFNTYRFADYKEACIDLLARVVTVSLQTVEITNAMKDLDRASWDS